MLWSLLLDEEKNSVWYADTYSSTPYISTEYTKKKRKFGRSATIMLSGSKLFWNNYSSETDIQIRDNSNFFYIVHKSQFSTIDIFNVI